MAHFFKRLSYSFGNEDWRTDHEALKVKPQDSVLCITASGDRPLHLLLNNCESITSIDANPFQNQLFNLKRFAMETLDFDHYLSFLGAIEGHPKQRWETFLKISPHMDDKSHQFWFKKKAMIQRGVLYQGFVEKKLKRIVAPGIRLFRGKKIDNLFEFTDLEKQKEFVEKKWDRLPWRKTIDIALGSSISRLLLRCIVSDPGIYDHLEGTTNIGSYFYKRMNDSLKNNLAQESVLLSLLLNGKVSRTAFPPYLTEEGVKVIKKHTHKVKTEDIDLISFLKKSSNNSFDCFSLSDVASYLNQNDFEIMMNEVKRVAKPNAKFSIRQFLSNHQLNESIKSSFKRDANLEKEIEKKDRCFVYRYMAGTIEK